MDRYAVVGNPISHSKSPDIHALFAEQTKQSMSYDRIELPRDGFVDGVKEFFAQADNKGLNVTVPFKEEAFELCEGLSDRAKRAGAVNTLYCNAEGALFGDTTDGVGLVNDLTRNHQIELEGAKILLVGAGGAARGVLQPILEEKPALLTVCNRTLSKVDTLIQAFADLGEIQKSAFDALDSKYDLIINASSASLSGSLPPIPEGVIGSKTIVYDMMYGNEVTVFNNWALSHGARKAIDGLGMLVEQAAEAFCIWRGVRPETKAVIASLRG